MARGDSADFDVPFEKSLFSPKNLATVLQIRRIIKHRGYDAVILNTALAAFLARAALPRKNRPRVVNIVHGYLFGKGVNPIRSAFFLLCEWLVRGRTDAIIVMNREDRELARRHRLTRGDVYLIPGMGATLRECVTPPEVLRKQLFPNGAFVLTFVGELSKRKNQSLLIDALKIIKQTIKNACLCLVGDGKERKKLERQAERLGLSESVRFLGYRSDACDLIRAADLYVSAARIEGLPFNVIEALGAEKTVICSRIKGHSDLISNGTDGFLFTVGNAYELAEAVVRIHRGELSLNPEKIRNKYFSYELSAVSPIVYSAIKSALNPKTQQY